MTELNDPRFIRGCLFQRLKRKLNLVIIGVQETEIEQSDTGDKNIIRTIISTLDPSATSNIKTIKRLRTKADKTRLVMVILSTIEEWNRIANTARNRTSRVLHNIRIKRDTHPATRAEWRRLFDVKDKEEKNAENPRCRITIDKRKRQALRDDNEAQEKPSDESFKNHFEIKMNPPDRAALSPPKDIQTYLPITDDPVQPQEVDKALRSLKKNKNSEPSGIPPGLLTLLPIHWIAYDRVSSAKEPDAKENDRTWTWSDNGSGNRSSLPKHRNDPKNCHCDCIDRRSARISNLNVDGTVILATNRDCALAKIRFLSDFCKSSGMVINNGKTKFVVIKGTDEDHQPLINRSQEINNCNTYTYLGSIFCQDSKMNTSIKAQCHSKLAHAVKFESFIKKNNDMSVIQYRLLDLVDVGSKQCCMHRYAVLQ
ncbi:hypothetical protein CAPTEDRAFT_212014 [Capitella teleta]|uniref:Reverse transcriptase domain-containing protein n=1 Tax=Capitella teleta TaxID=283909 RepID=R7THR0_CAPTE|nr:hypothetical protein CAPTEDRAFT_212014 [Capitella teleta]|eukprot:ELT91101.1 hypothetical protein CAPTEDRAFT_212014 [Capitella teleta]